MADKMTCPACDTTTSGVLSAYNRGDDCPYCGLPRHAAEAVFKAREKGVNEELERKYLHAAQRAADAEEKVGRLVYALREIKAALLDDEVIRNEL